MKTFYLYLISFLMIMPAFSQTHFRTGYEVTFSSSTSIPKRDLTFGNFPNVVNDYFTGGAVPCSGGMKHLTKTKGGGLSQTMLNLDNGSALDIDFGLYPYTTIRVQSTANTDITMTLTLKNGSNPSKSFIIKGGGAWTIARLDFGDQKVPGTTNELQWAWSEPAGTTYPYELYFDYIRFGGVDDKGAGATFNTGDPDSTVKMSFAPVANQICEKDGGEQSILLADISNGIDVANLSLSQKNSKSTLFESITFGPINLDGTCTMNYTPKAGLIGISNVQLLLTYNRADTVKKYKSIWFDIKVAADPVAKVPAVITAQMNQPKVTSKLTSIMNSIGSTDKLTLEVTSNNPDLVTNLKADAVKSDGTALVSFIPGSDKCGKDILTITLTDTSTNRSQTYTVPVDVVNPNGPCEDPGALENSKDGELMFANPAYDDKLTITLPSDLGGKIYIADITGRNLIEKTVPMGQTKIELFVGQLKDGVYFVVFEKNNQKIVKKLLIK